MTGDSLHEAYIDIVTADKTFDEILLVSPASQELLSEGKWIKTNGYSIRIDNPTHGVGQRHAHIYARKGNELGVVNLDGTASHGKKMRLSQAQADDLRAQGFTVPKDRVVEWLEVKPITLELMFG